MFLSSSVPDPRRDARYYTTADVIAIREAVTAIAEVVLPRGHLVFGGHPAISPMIARIAAYFGRESAVTAYQSEFFRSKIPPATLKLPIEWTRDVLGDRQRSLERMRQEMLDTQSGTRQYAAGFFVGGMEGVEAEFELFRKKQPNASFWAIPSTGAAARIIYAGHRSTILLQPFAQRRHLTPATLGPMLEHDRTYRDLVRCLLALR